MTRLLADIPSTQMGPNWRRKVLEGLAPAVSAIDLQHYYVEAAGKKQVLHDNTLDIYPGEIIIMTGPSGSGKTTLLTLIGTLRKVQEGRLNVLGRPLHEVNDADLLQLRKEIGFIFQAHNLFDSLTATQNVRMALELVDPSGSRAEQNARAVEMLEAVDLGTRTEYKPQKLSGGQKQRVAIARGLVHRPKLVLADEPTAALDETVGKKVVELFRKMADEEQATIIIVTHDHRVIETADRIINLVNGRIRSNVSVQEAQIVSDMLRQCKLFEKLSPGGLAEMSDRLRTEWVDAGENIIREGDAGDKFYLIRQGSVSVRRGPEQQEVATLHDGAFFGEQALLHEQPRNASVNAVTDTILYVLSKEHFRKAMDEQASFASEIRTSLLSRQ